MLELQELQGKLVEISKHGPVQPLADDLEDVDEHAAAIEVEGLKGSVIGARHGNCIVETFSGAFVEIPPESVKEFEPAPGEEGGFDAVWDRNGDRAWDFSISVIGHLMKKGFCVVQTAMTPEARQDALAGATEQMDWKRLIKELEPAYLGRSPSGKMAWISSHNSGSSLDTCDGMLSNLSEMLSSASPEMLGFTAWGRTDGMIRMPFNSADEEGTISGARETLDDAKIHDQGALEEHLKFVQRRKICMFYFVSGSGGSLVLHPKGAPDITIPCEESRLVVFRHDRLSYTYMPSGKPLALQAWILSEGLQTMVQEFNGPLARHDAAMGLKAGPSTPTYGSTGKAVSLMSLDCMLAGNGLGNDYFWTVLVSGTDGCRHLPNTRWDPEMYYEPEKDLAMGKYYSNHGGFVLEDTCVSFDNEFFSIPEYQADMMDPCMRNSMEIGYSTLLKGGWDRSSLKGARIGVFFGFCGTDWTSVKMSPEAGFVNNDLFLNCTSSHCMNSRLSYILDMRGPMATSDTACSSSLVAMGTAHNSLRRTEPDQVRSCQHSHIEWALVVGTNGLWGPFSWIGLCGPKMLSATGRCFTFDHSADGFARGEGTTALTATVTEKEPSGRLGTFCGSCINQDGRSASMTAPHGPSQQECILASLREANVVPADIRVAELHGTGTALGDPIELGALRGVMKKRDGPILKVSFKSNAAHGEANAGMAGLIKCFIMLMYSSGPPNVHLVDLNPHCDLNGYPCYIPSEMVDLGTNSGYAGVSSFGFGGTNARADLWARGSVGVRKAVTLDDNKLDYLLARCAHCMGWMEYVSGVMMPSWAPKPVSGRFKANTIRDEYDDYSVCSLCYTGSYQFGVPATETPIPSGKMFITGTWDAWTVKQEIQQAGDGAYHFVFKLGETRVERFYFMLNQNEGLAFFPASELAGMEIRTEGPSELKPGLSWQIDGRDEGWKEGTVIHISMWSDPANGSRKVKWEPLEAEDTSPETTSYRHHYSVIGSFNAKQMSPMRPKKDEKGVYEYSLKLGVSGQEYFQIVRDNSLEQLIYPAYPMAHQPGVFVRGPDHLGADLFWAVRGQVGEKVAIRLSVVNGHITVSVDAPSTGALRWESVEGPARRRFYVWGAWIPGNGTARMQQSTHDPNVYMLQMQMTSGLEDFQILLDEDPKRAIHPEVGGFPCGEMFVNGPDANGKGKSFQIQGLPGDSYEILLDLGSYDKRRTVTWRAVQEDGLPMLPDSDVKALTM